jgi:hypothetical protein
MKKPVAVGREKNVSHATAQRTNKKFSWNYKNKT